MKRINSPYQWTDGSLYPFWLTQVPAGGDGGHAGGGKYESKTMCFPSTHVIIFDNFKPKIRNENNELTLSMDRWVIIPLLAQTETKEDFNTMR